jgi:lambda family phage minor tail protein L
MANLFSTTIDGYLNLMTIDLTAHGDQVYGFIDSSTFTTSNPVLSTVTWNGQNYTPIPFSTSGYERGGQTLVKPKVSLPDLGGIMYITLAKYQFASGAPVVRYQALASDIIANDPNAPFMEEHYLVNQVTFDGFTLECELATHVDYQRAKFPAHICYRSEFPGLGSMLAS